MTHHHHGRRRQKKQHVLLWLEENDRVRDDGRGVGVVGVGIQSETRRGRGGVFGNVRRRIGRMGEIGSRAIHGCVVVVSFLLCLRFDVVPRCVHQLPLRVGTAVCQLCVRMRARWLRAGCSLPATLVGIARAAQDDRYPPEST